MSVAKNFTGDINIVILSRKYRAGHNSNNNVHHKEPV